MLFCKIENRILRKFYILDIDYSINTNFFKMEIQQPPKTWLLQSLLVTILTFLCCSNILGLPFGIAAIVNASSVESKFNRGDFEGADKASKNAKYCTIVTGVLAVVSVILFAVLYVFGLLAFLSAANYNL